MMQAENRQRCALPVWTRTLFVARWCSDLFVCFSVSVFVSCLLGLSSFYAWFSQGPVLQLHAVYNFGAQSEALLLPEGAVSQPANFLLDWHSMCCQSSACPSYVLCLSVCMPVSLSVSVIASLLAFCCLALLSAWTTCSLEQELKFVTRSTILLCLVKASSMLFLFQNLCKISCFMV